MWVVVGWVRGQLCSSTKLLVELIWVVTKNAVNSGHLVPFFFYSKSYFFCDFKPHAKFWNPTITPSRRKGSVGEEKEEKEKNAVNSGHFVSVTAHATTRTN